MAKFYRKKRQKCKFRSNLNTPYYFAYGMNTNLQEMAGRCPKAVNLGRVTLQNYELKFRGPADIDYAPGMEMQGVLWRITPECEAALDRLEGYPYMYTKIRVKIDLDKPINNMTYIWAMAYIMTGKCQEYPPGIHYEQCLLNGYEDNGLDIKPLTEAVKRVILNDNKKYQSNTYSKSYFDKSYTGNY